MLLTDPAGNIVPRGRVVIGDTFHFLRNAIPDGLQVSGAGATSSVQMPDAGRSFLQVNTGALSGAAARVETDFEFATSGFEEIIWTVEGVYADSAAVSMILAINGTNCGVALRHAGDNANAYLEVYGSGGSVETVETNYGWGLTGQPQKRRNLTLRIQPKAKQIYVMSDDQVVLHHDATATWQDGACRAKMTIVNIADGARYFRVGQLKFALLQN